MKTKEDALTLLEDIPAWNRYRKEHPDWIPDLRGANLISMNLTHANLTKANLEAANLIDADLRHADLKDANLTSVNLCSADLTHANLKDANLRDAILVLADLTLANLKDANLPDIATVPRLFTAMLERLESGWTLEMGSWHDSTCKTTHCMAGMAIALAGKAGQSAEDQLGSAVAGALIINQSCPYLEGKVPDFYSCNDYAMEFIRGCAAKEKELAGSGEEVRR